MISKMYMKTNYLTFGLKSENIWPSVCRILVSTFWSGYQYMYKYKSVFLIIIHIILLDIRHSCHN